MGTHACGGARLVHDGAPVRIKLRCLLRYDAPEETMRRLVEWSIPRPHLTVNKPIRWWIHSHYPGASDHSEDDRAPDAGWYP